jgi:exosortase K
MPNIINKKTICIGAIMVTAFILKLLYPSASTEDLKLFVQPTAEIISIVNHQAFTCTPNGFFFSEVKVLIDKSCSGFNFFIIALCVFASIVPYHYLTKRQCAALMSALVVVTYVITICVNTSRIVIAMFMLRLEPSMPWITQPWVHEAEGALVYLFALLGAYLIITHYLNKFNLLYAKRSQPVVAAGH